MFSRIVVQALGEDAPAAELPLLALPQETDTGWRTPDFYGLFSEVPPSTTAAGNGRAAQAFGLAVCQQVRHWCIQDRVQLITATAPGRVELYGGFFFVRRADGTLNSNLVGVHVENAFITELSTLILRALSTQVLSGMRARVSNLFVAQAMQEGLSENEAKKQLASFEQWVDWALWAFKPSLWGRNRREAVWVKTLAKALWDTGVLDKAVFREGIRIYGFGRLTGRQYNKLCENLPAVKARLDEVPNLAPLFSPELIESHGSAALHVLRQTFLEHEGTPAGWRWLTRQGWTFLRTQVGGNLRDPNSNRMFSAFAAAQVGRLPGSPRLSFNRYLFWDASSSSSTGSSSPTMDAYSQKRMLERTRYVVMMRHFSREYESRRTKVSDLLHQLPLVMDFVKNMGPTENLNKATWSSLVRRQHAWHLKQARERREAEKAQRGLYQWMPLTMDQAYRNLVAVSLNTSDELWEEGDVMSHCVGGYSGACMANRSRIYSIRSLEGDRVATLEIVQEKGRWKTRQLYGPQNRAITDKAVEALAKQVVRAANRAESLNPADNVVIREPERPRTSLPFGRGLGAPDPVRREPELDEIPF